MLTLKVELGARSYPIYIGKQLLGDAELLHPYIYGNSAVIVSNETVAPLYLQQVETMLSGIRHTAVILPDGEKYKNLDILNRIYTAMLENHLDRNTTVIALGGGVVGDMAGFAAASYQRGVGFIQIPTTLLSQVDSSVGGKTGVNHALGKNMIGAFYQPRAVIADIHTLHTLPDRELSAGLAEIIKYGLIGNADFFSWLEQNMHALLAKDEAALSYAIEVSCQTKADIVAADERESGKRALLNLGHTFGHAIENAMGYGQWLHGEAIAVGMAMAATMSAQMHTLSQADVQRIDNLLARANLPTRPPADISSEQFLSLMSVDKKVIDGVLRLVLLHGIGNAVVSSDYTPAQLLDAINTTAKNSAEPAMHNSQQDNRHKDHDHA